MKKITLIFLILANFHLSAQNLILDSLYQINQNKKMNDTTKILVLNEIALELRYTLPDSSLRMVEKNLKNATKMNFINGIAGAEYILGIHQTTQSNYAEAIKIYFKCLDTFEKTKNNIQIARVINNIAIIYYRQKKYDKAEAFFKKALKINQKISNYDEIARCYNNLGRIYFSQNKTLIALTYAQKVLQVIELNKVKGDLAIYYCNVAEYSMKLDKTKQSLEYAKKTLDFAMNTKNPRMIARAYIIEAAVFNKENQIEKAAMLLAKAEEILLKSKYTEEELLYLEYAYQINQKQKNYEKSLLLFQKYINLKDSVESTRNYKATLQKDYEYTEKINEQNREIEREKELLTRVFLYSGLSILLILLFFTFRAFYMKSKTLRIISEQKNIIELKTTEITTQKSILEQTYKELKSTSDELDRSLNYASKVQNLILPTSQDLKDFFGDFFVIFKPKDVVSGDFYSFTQINNEKGIFVMADCTGHGVSGAFMTMLSNALLHEIIKERMITSPALIIKELHDSIFQILKQHNGNNTDGMDVSICLFDKNEIENKLEITFAGSKSSMYYIDNQSLTKISGDKSRVGGKEYKNFEINNQYFVLPLKTTQFYFITDGFYDQNNGLRKKFGLYTLQNMLVENSHFSLDIQKQNILQALETHQGNEMQRDDISLIGLNFGKK